MSSTRHQPLITNNQMGLQDLLLTPLYLLLIFMMAYVIRPWVTDKYTYRYFMPGLGVKIVGAVAVGLIYQFYYGGGDTFNYYHDVGFVWKAFLESPVSAFKLIFGPNTYQPDTFDYASQMWFFRDFHSYGVVRFAGFFSLFSFNVYTVIACMFAVLSFSGLWVLYLTFYNLYPHLHKQLAWAVLFIPSVFFWGSGLLKDTLTLTAVGWATFAVYKLFFRRERIILFSFILFLSCWLIYSIKIYILLCFLPSVILWVFLTRVKKIQSMAFKVVLTPVVLVIAAGLGYLAILKIGEDSHRYSLDKLAYTAETSARWLAYVSEVQGGSAYTLGDFDYTPAGMLKKLPLAINVTLFRPYLWEVKNPVMLLSAIESFAALVLTLYVFYKRGIINTFRSIGANPFLGFCLLFSLSFAFAVGIVTYNFGSLVRYKIPLLPFYAAVLVVLYPYSLKRPRKTEVLDSTEKRSVTA